MVEGGVTPTLSSLLGFEIQGVALAA